MRKVGEAGPEKLYLVKIDETSNELNEFSGYHHLDDLYESCKEGTEVFEVELKSLGKIKREHKLEK